MPIKLSRPFASNSAVADFDVRQMKKVLNRLGYYQPFDKTGITGISDADVFTSLKEFQKDNNLPATGTAKPDDETVEALNHAAEKTPDGYYIWRIVEDGHARAAHAKLNRTIRKWSDSPDPGDDYNCRCWAKPVSKEDVELVYSEGINSMTIGPAELLLGGFLKGGISIGFKAIQTLEQLLKRKPQLNELQTRNLARFISKIPANSKNSIEFSSQTNGNVKFTATSAGKVPGSKAVYEKTVNSKGQTIDFRKTSYDKNNKIIHIKDKINKGDFNGTR